MYMHSLIERISVNINDMLFVKVCLNYAIPRNQNSFSNDTICFCRKAENGWKYLFLIK